MEEDTTDNKHIYNKIYNKIIEFMGIYADSKLDDAVKTTQFGAILTDIDKDLKSIYDKTTKIKKENEKLIKENFKLQEDNETIKEKNRKDVEDIKAPECFYIEQKLNEQILLTTACTKQEKKYIKEIEEANTKLQESESATNECNKNLLQQKTTYKTELHTWTGSEKNLQTDLDKCREKLKELENSKQPVTYILEDNENIKIIAELKLEIVKLQELNKQQFDSNTELEELNRNLHAELKSLQTQHNLCKVNRNVECVISDEKNKKYEALIYILINRTKLHIEAIKKLIVKKK